jgi:hypothetical protein
MGGEPRKSQPLYPADKIQMSDLVHRTEGNQSQPGYSDEYSKKLTEERKKQMTDLMDALSRLGMVDQLAPRGMVPRMPYRPLEPKYPFAAEAAGILQRRAPGREFGF